MSVHLYLAPAAAGKTAYAVKRACQAARDPAAQPRVVVANPLQVGAWHSRLAEAGGVLGVRVMTFDHLYVDCLAAAGEVYTQLSEPVLYRLLRAIVDRLPLSHYASLVDRPGFIHALQRQIAELKGARIWPETFSTAVHSAGNEPRLTELADVYAAYQDTLQARKWADRAGVGWLAIEALALRAPGVAHDWPLLIIDGFDNFTPVQIDLLQLLAHRAGETFFTLTGTVDRAQRPLVHRRFNDTCRRLVEALQDLHLAPEPLPERQASHAPVLAHLEASLFQGHDDRVGRQDSQGAVELIAAPDRAGEVRAALRWIKARLVLDGLTPDQVALLARNVQPYRPFIQQIAGEMGIPIRLVDGLPLRANPAVAAILDLMRLMLPDEYATARHESGPSLPRRLVIEAWRCPYFDWQTALPYAEADGPIGISARDADHLENLALSGRVIAGLSQWQEAFDTALATAGRVMEEEEPETRVEFEASRAAIEALRARFQRFVRRMTPGPDLDSYRGYTGWLEDLIGTDPQPSTPYDGAAPEPSTSLDVVGRARNTSPTLAERDVSALRTLKEVLRGLVWAEEAMSAGQRIDYATFFRELAGAIEATTYRPPLPSRDPYVLVSGAVGARGLPFRTVAVLGLAEGEFPTTLNEDPFLRDADRQRLREEYNLPLESSTESAEIEFFYETMTRPRERLLLTRPRLADNGAPWQASPFWEETCRLVKVEQNLLTSDSAPPAGMVASWPELMEVVAHQAPPGLKTWALQAAPGRCAQVEKAAHVMSVRMAGDTSPFDGDLATLSAPLSVRFGPQHIWSASRLEAYRTCPFMFLAANVLRLLPRPEPIQGLDIGQLGNIYHRILKQLFEAPLVDDPSNLEQLLAQLPVVAGRLLDTAPEDEGFRETAWWTYTRQAIEQSLEQSLVALDEYVRDYVPISFETWFGGPDGRPLELSDGQDRLMLRGVIDRIDRRPDGGLLVIDYKTAGPSTYGNRTLFEGRRLQLALYALAARDALGLGQPVEGFYWHVQHATPSPLQLSKLAEGPETAYEVAREISWQVVRAAREGNFKPHTPDYGCPPYCPAAAFCWHYRPGFGG